MQRMIEATLIAKILEKYEQRYKECSEQWDSDYVELGVMDEQKAKGKPQQWTDHERRDFIINDILALNAQISAYECIIKDLKGLIK